MAEVTQAFGMDALQYRRVEADRPQFGEPLKDKGEGLPTRSSSRLARPTQATQVRPLTQSQQRVELAALPGLERSSQQACNMALRVEESLRHHAFDLADTGNDDTTMAKLVEQQTCQLGAAGRRQGHRQER